MLSHLTRFGFAFISAVLLSVLSFAIPSVSVADVTVTGFDHEAVPPVSTGSVPVYHWTLQEDVMFHVDPGNPPTGLDLPLAGSFHKSHLPVLASGTFGGTVSEDPAVALAAIRARGTDWAAKHYFLSALPAVEYNLGGTQIKPGQTDIEIHVNKLPIPTAQISVFVFEDNMPINGAPDGNEEGLGGFELLLEEAGGKYGISAGQVLVDAFGNALGSTYLPNGDLDVAGSGRLFTGPDGRLTIKHLPPAKYAIKVVDKAGWSQTSTIEGSKVIDAWVLAKEPAFFTEFGPPGPHVFVGFVQAFDGLPALAAGDPTVTLTGTVGNVHTSRQPDPTFYSSEAFGHDGCWVGLNSTAAGGGLGQGPANYAASCDVDAGDGTLLNTFTISGVPAGSYQLVVWSKFLTTIIAYKNIVVGVDAIAPAGLECISQPNKSCDLQNVGVFNWFGRQENFLFADTNQNGFWDDGEVNLQAEFGTNLRFRDGTVYQSIPTDLEGAAPYDVVFPFFSWFVSEVDFGAPLKATGATHVVDAGGPVPADDGWDSPSGGLLNPQPQFNADGTPNINPNTLNNLSRTEKGVVLTQGFQNFLGTTNVTHWGKVPYKNGENGGISGVLFYGVTRAENDPAAGAGEPWEPGIPRVQIALYEDTIDFSTFPFKATGVIKDQLPVNTAVDEDRFPTGNFPGQEDIDLNGNGILDVTSSFELADVDNYPLGWQENGGAPGPEDVDRNHNGAFDLGDALEVTYTDSWDDSLPTGCMKDVLPGDTDVDALPTGNFPGTEDTDHNGNGVFDGPFVLNGVELDCYDGLRNYNQQRPATFDGGYAFAGREFDFDDTTDGMPFPTGPNDIDHDGLFGLAGDTGHNGGLEAGFYIVEAATPSGYELMKEEDQNVGFGAEFIPTPDALPKECVGDDHIVPLVLTLQTDSGGNVLPGVTDPMAPEFAGLTKKLCDRKGVQLANKQNAAADFWLLTKAPIAALGKGFILNDLANEFDPRSPQFGEKYAPPFMPIAVRDWNGREISRFYSDEFGNYNMPTPSTFSANVPNPSGFSPGMFHVCMNDKGPIPAVDASGNPIFENGNPVYVSDPAHNKQYSQFCYPLQFMPGSTTYLDTPVVPVAAFTGSDAFPLDCECEDEFPAIKSVNGPASVTPGGSGPWIPRTGASSTVVIKSQGMVEVPNPAYEGPNTGTAKTILRNYGFAPAPGDGGGVPPVVTLTRTTNGVVTTLPIAYWDRDQIIATVPTSITRRNNREYQLMVTRGDNDNTSKVGITFTVRNAGSAGNPAVHHVFPDPANPSATPIQDKIDSAIVSNGELVIVHPGIYSENVIMHKGIKLQCSGAGSTFINVPSLVGSRRVAWMEKVETLFLDNAYDLLPEQEAARAGDGIEAGLGTEAGAGILVVANDTNRNEIHRIDGCSVTGGDNGGGVVVNAFVDRMTISNNRISNNYGVLAGGVRFGNPTLINDGNYPDAKNDNARIHHNMITQNGSSGFGGGGIGIYTGTDRYRVSDNFICGNFTQGHGAGIAHLGFSGGRSGNGNRLADNRIVDNAIIFNQSFNQGQTRHGGGIFVGGQPPTGGQLSRGSGSVLIDSNLIQGNNAGTGEGAGIRLDTVNARLQRWNRAINKIDIINNRIVNNVAGLAGGGISLFDATDVDIVNNTIANNDSTATHGSLFDFATNSSMPQPAGIISHANSAGLDARLVRGNRARRFEDFSNPRLIDNIITHNRSFKVELDDVTFDPPRLVLLPDVVALPGSVVYDDLAVVGTGDPADVLHPQSSILSAENGLEDVDSSGFPNLANPGAYAAVADNNQAADPGLVNEYSNGSRASVAIPEGTTNVAIQGAFDEGGNFIDMQYGPLTINAVEQTDTTVTPAPDYHILPGSSGIQAGEQVGGIRGLGLDFDNESRAIGSPDIGADELH